MLWWQGLVSGGHFQIVVHRRGNPGKVGRFHYIEKMAVDMQKCGRRVTLAQQGTTGQKLWWFADLTPPICVWILNVSSEALLTRQLTRKGSWKNITLSRWRPNRALGNVWLLPSWSYNDNSDYSRTQRGYDFKFD